MKQILVIVGFFLICSCESREEKVKKICKAHLNENLHDFKSYEPVSWGSIDSVYTDPESSDRVKELQTDFFDLKSDIEKRLDSIKLYGEAWTAIGEIDWRVNYVTQKTEELKLLKNETDSIVNNWKAEFDGYKINHTFRSKNLAGNYRIAHYTFFLNPELNKVVRILDNSESN